VQIAILAYPGMTALDAIGPFDVLRGLRGAEFRFVWREPGPIRTDSGVLILGATHSFDETPAPDIVLVGGSITDTMATAADREVLAWLRKVHDTTTWTASVCSGSLILAAAGLLDGKPATCHWAAQSALRGLGAKPQRHKRIVRHGKIVTAAGVSAGIDLGLWLVGEIAGPSRAEAVQLAIEYDPHPPFDSGHPSKASVGVKASAALLIRDMMSAREVGGELMAGSTVMWSSTIRQARSHGIRQKRRRNRDGASTTADPFRSHYVLLSTYRSNGAEVRSPVWVAEESGRLLVWTETDSFKVKRIRQNPSVMVQPCTFRGIPKGAAVRGHAELLDDAGTARVRTLLARKYGLLGRLAIRWRWPSYFGPSKRMLHDIVTGSRPATIGIAITLDEPRVHDTVAN
jgi:PPOX class probable F420-dependent enzyme